MSFESSVVWAEEGFLSFGGKPGRGYQLEGDLLVLRSINIGAILSLVEIEHNLTVYTESGFDAKHVPVPDLQAPEPEQFEMCIRFLHEQRRKATAVYVPCLAGYGRSATVSAAWLIARGAQAEDAIRRIRRLKPGTIESDAQYNALLEYGARRQLHGKMES